MIKIAHIITDSNIGGAGILLCNLLSEIDKARFSVSVILPRDSALVPRLKGLDISVVEADIKPDCSLAVGDFFTLFTLLKRLSPDIVHTHASLTARVAAKLLKKPICILTRHCDTPLRVPTFFYNRLADFTVATSLSLYRHMLDYGLPKNRLSFIANGAKRQRKISKEDIKRLKRELRIDEDARVIGIVGRLEKIKGQSVFLEAAAKLLKKESEYVFLLLGDGSLRAELEALADSLGVRESVRFCGYRENPGDFMNLFDISVNASLGSETTCLAISEAFSLSIPVIASDIEGNRYMLDCGRAGLLFKNGDSDSLASALERLLSDDKLKRCLGKKGKMRYESEFTPSAMARKYEALYSLCKPDEKP